MQHIRIPVGEESHIRRILDLIAVILSQVELSYELLMLPFHQCQKQYGYLINRNLWLLRHSEGIGTAQSEE
jgi:hypothetical protein